MKLNVVLTAHTEVRRVLLGYRSDKFVLHLYVFWEEKSKSVAEN